MRKDSEPRPAPPLTRTDAGVLALLVAATWACYAQSLGFQFVYDDRILILHNPAILSWRSFPHYFDVSFIGTVFPHAPANYYRPLTLTWMLINQKLWHFHPAGWHLAAVLVESAAVAAFYFLARRILGERQSAGAAAAIFALHPLLVECVAWVMAVQEPWVVLLIVSALLAHLRGRESSRRAAWVAASAALFALATLVKEDALVFPGMVFVYEWVYHQAGEEREWWREWWTRGLTALKHTAPFIAVAAGYFAARLAALGGFTHPATPLAISTVLLTLPEVIWRYFHLLAWPVGLSAFYDVPYVTHAGAHFLLPLAGVAGTLLALAAGARRSRAVAFASAWVLLPLLPLLDLGVFPPGEIVHDRYLYMSTVGLALLAAMGLRWLRAARGGKALELAAALGLAVLLGAGTIYYGRFWRDNFTLYRRGVAVAPGNNLAVNNLANEYVHRGQLGQAIPLYVRVLERDPGYWMANYNLGYCFYRLNRLEAARHFLRRATALNPGDADGYLYFALTNLKLGELDEAERAAHRALALAPTGRGFHLTLGVILRARGELTQALEEFRAELRLFPSETAARSQTQEVERQLRGASPRPDATTPPPSRH